jgi:predicted short-subunit dehydrogenase-like oxidoreductase (DUF2520 family)
VKAWGDEPRRDAAGDERNDKIEAIEAAGIDLDPRGRGSASGPGSEAPDSGLDHDHGDGRPHDHAHPHVASAAGAPPVIGIVGAGAVGTALGVALTRAGWPVAAVASRDPGRRERFRGHVPGARAFAEATALVEEVELVIVAVPDDAIPSVASSLRLYSGQAIVHTSGLLDASALAPAMAAGTQAGSFHPLVAFADTERAVAALRGATIAIEGDDQLAALLARMADALGGVPVRLAAGAKAAYHAAAVLAAGGFVALAVYGPLIEQTLGNARALGIAAALTGPATRGDAGTLEAHLAALRTHAPGVVALYVAAAEREIELAAARGAVTPEVARRLRSSLATHV